MSRRRSEWTVRVDNIGLRVTLTIPALCMTPRTRARLAALQRLVVHIAEDEWTLEDPGASMTEHEP